MDSTYPIGDETLLLCICNYTPLFNKRSKGYKSVLQKENCWQAVAKHLEITVNLAKARFKSLREKYRREIAIEEKLTRSGAGSNSRPQWPLMGIFKYMMDDADCRRTVTNIHVAGVESKQLEEDAEAEPDTYYEIDTLDSSPEDENFTAKSSCSSSFALASTSAQVPKGYESPSELKNPPSETPTRLAIPKRKRLATLTVDNDQQQINDILKNVSSAVSDIAKNATQKEQSGNKKFEKFAAYLVSELEDFKQEDANIFMDLVTENLLKYKKKLRNE